MARLFTHCEWSLFITISQFCGPFNKFCSFVAQIPNPHCTSVIPRRPHHFDRYSRSTASTRGFNTTCTVFSGESILAYTFNYTLTTCLAVFGPLESPLSPRLDCHHDSIVHSPPSVTRTSRSPHYPTNPATHSPPLHLKPRSHFLSLSSSLPFYQLRLETDYALPRP